MNNPERPIDGGAQRPNTRAANSGSAAAQQPETGMPKAFYKVSDGRYVEGARYEAMRAEPGNQLPQKADAQALLFPATDEKSLMSGQQMRRYHLNSLRRVRQEEGLPDSIEHQHDAQPPRALIYDRQSRELVTPAIAQQRLGGGSISAQVDPKHIYLSNMSVDGSPTGNFSNVPYFKSKNTARKLNERLAADIDTPDTQTLPNSDRRTIAATEPPMPKAFYKVSEGQYVEGSRYEAMRAEPGSQLPERAKAQALLFPDADGKSLMSGQQMRRYYKTAFEAVRDDEGLPASIEKQHDANPPRALIYDRQSRDLVSPAIAQQRLGDGNISATVDPKHIYLSNIDIRGNPTGNFSNAPYFKAKNSAAELSQRLAGDVDAPNPQTAVRQTRETRGANGVAAQSTPAPAAEARVPASSRVQPEAAMPKAFYKVSDGRYVEGASYEAMRAEPGNQLPEKANAHALLFPAADGKSLMSGSGMHANHRRALGVLRQEEGLPASVKDQHDPNPPRALIYDRQSRELVTPAIAQQRFGDGSISASVDQKHIYLSNMDIRGNPTGNFSNAPYFKTRNGAAEQARRLAGDVDPTLAARQPQQDLPPPAPNIRPLTRTRRSEPVAVAQFEGNLDRESTELLVAIMRGEYDTARSQLRLRQPSADRRESGRGTPVAQLIDPYGDQGRQSAQTGSAARGVGAHAPAVAEVMSIERSGSSGRSDRDRSRERAGLGR